MPRELSPTILLRSYGIRNILAETTSMNTFPTHQVSMHTFMNIYNYRAVNGNICWSRCFQCIAKVAACSVAT